MCIHTQKRKSQGLTTVLYYAAMIPYYDLHFVDYAPTALIVQNRKTSRVKWIVEAKAPKRICQERYLFPCHKNWSNEESCNVHTSTEFWSLWTHRSVLIWNLHTFSKVNEQNVNASLDKQSCHFYGEDVVRNEQFPICNTLTNVKSKRTFILCSYVVRIYARSTNRHEVHSDCAIVILVAHSLPARLPAI